MMEFFNAHVDTFFAGCIFANGVFCGGAIHERKLRCAAVYAVLGLVCAAGVA